MHVVAHTQHVAVVQSLLLYWDSAKGREDAEEDPPPPLPDIGSHIFLDGADEPALGLPPRPVPAVVSGHFDAHDAIEPGVLARVSLSELSGQEVEYVHDRGLFLPRAEGMTDVWPPLQLEVLGREVIVPDEDSPRAYIVYEHKALAESTRRRMQDAFDEVQAEMSNGEVRHVYTFVGLDSNLTHSWTALDYAWHFANGIAGASVTEEDLRRTSSDVFFIADEHTHPHFSIAGDVNESGDAATSSLLAVVQKRQSPHRMDPIRTARHTPLAAGYLAFSLPHLIPVDAIGWTEDCRELHRYRARPPSEEGHRG